MMSLTRRRLLHAAGAGAGAALFAPFFKDALANSTTPARLVIVMECNSFYPVTVLSSQAQAALGSGVAGRTNFNNTYPSTAKTITGDAPSTALSLGPLAASAGNISLDNRTAVVLGLSSVVAGGGHTSGTGALSCAVDGAGATLDAVLAPQLKANAPFDAVRLGTSSSATPIVYQTCNFAPHKPAPIVVNPALGYQSLFGSIAAGQSAGPERVALFDFVAGDVQRALNTFRGNSNERAKLERYLTALQTLSSREQQLMAVASSVRPLLPVDPSVNPLLPTDATGQPDHMKWLEAMFQMATTCLLGGLTNNVVLASATSGFDIHYAQSITTYNRHNLQHGIGVAANWTAIHTITQMHVSLIAQLARTLAATPEVGAPGSMLDHTAILFISDNGEQHHSVAQEWPAMLIGGNALGLKTDGRTVIYPAYAKPNNRQVSNLFNTLGHAMGISNFDTFGSEGSTRIAPGPLSELI
jgi:hypothetical protein